MKSKIVLIFLILFTVNSFGFFKKRTVFIEFDKLKVVNRYFGLDFINDTATIYIDNVPYKYRVKSLNKINKFKEEAHSDSIYNDDDNNEYRQLGSLYIINLDSTHAHFVVNRKLIGNAKIKIRKRDLNGFYETRSKPILWLLIPTAIVVLGTPPFFIYNIWTE